jgi:hypothetical protein
MAVYVVDYDLRQPDHDYRPLIDALRQYESCHALKSTWYRLDIERGRHS